MNSISFIEDFNKKFKTEKYIVISEEELTGLLNSSKIIFEQDTRLRGYLRILKVRNLFYLQETTNRDEIILRKFSNKHEAMKVVDDRLQIYDKMWDGCGCKINYYE